MNWKLPRKKKKKLKYRHEIRYKTPFLTSCHYNVYHYNWLFNNPLYNNIDNIFCINQKFPRFFKGNLTKLKKEIL